MLTATSPRIARWGTAVVAVLLLSRSALGLPPGAAGRPMDEVDGYASDRIVVTFAPGTLGHADARTDVNRTPRRAGAIAKIITGSHWNGFLFFKIAKPNPGPTAENAKPRHGQAAGNATPKRRREVTRA